MASIASLTAPSGFLTLQSTNTSLIGSGRAIHFLRAVRSGSSLAFAWSSDGTSLRTLLTYSTPLTINRIGLFHNFWNANGNGFRWFYESLG